MPTFGEAKWNDPCVCRVTPVRMSTRVVLPAPFLPKSPKICDWYMVRLTPLSAFTLESLTW